MLRLNGASTSEDLSETHEQKLSSQMENDTALSQDFAATLLGRFREVHTIAVPRKLILHWIYIRQSQSLWVIRAIRVIESGWKDTATSVRFFAMCVALSNLSLNVFARI